MSFEIINCVGLKQKNNNYDVKLLQALLNVYARRNNRKSLAITGRCDSELIDYQVTVDLKFRGDYTPSARGYLQETIANNDLDSFKKVISNRSLWARVPGDRFKKRVKYVQ